MKVIFAIAALPFVLFTTSSFAQIDLTGDTKIGVEVSYSGTKSKIVVPRLLSSTYDIAESGNGNDIAIGVTFEVTERVVLRGGYRRWKWPFNHIVNGEIDEKDVKAKETGNLNYYGTYFNVDGSWKYFYVTGGFDVSLKNKYKNDLEIFDNSGRLIVSEKDREESILTDKFKNQFNLVLGLGPVIPIGNAFKIKGSVCFVLPFSPVYDTGVTVPDFQVHQNGSTTSGTSKVDLDFFPVFKYGISVEYTLFN